MREGTRETWGERRDREEDNGKMTGDGQKDRDRE